MIALTTHDNAPPPADWQPFGRHCGLLCFDRACSICGEWVEPDVVLGEN